MKEIFFQRIIDIIQFGYLGGRKLEWEIVRRKQGKGLGWKEEDILCVEMKFIYVILKQ